LSDAVVPLIPAKVFVVQKLHGDLTAPEAKAVRSAGVKLFPPFTTQKQPDCRRAAGSIVTDLCSAATRLREIW
jgi:hypothetical protein